jgi:hypothetical protein
MLSEIVSKEFPTALKKENVAVNDQIKVLTKIIIFLTNTLVLTLSPLTWKIW